MQEPPSMKCIAEALGISRATVSNVLSGKGRVSADVAARVRAIAEQLNYVPSHAARSLRLGRSTLIGLVVPNFSMPLFADFAQAFERAARARGMALMVADSMSDPALQNQRLQDFVARGADGLVIIPMREAELSTEALQVPVAVVDAKTNPANIASCDHRQGGRLVAQHLADLGHESVRIVVSAQRSLVSHEREAGLVEGLSSRGVPFVIDRIIPTLDSARIYASEWNGTETAIATAYDTLGVGIVAGLADRGISVPHAVSVTGFDDVIWGRIVTPQLTTVRQDLSAIADHALDVATGRASGPRLFPATLVVRGSTSRPERRET